MVQSVVSSLSVNETLKYLCLIYSIHKIEIKKKKLLYDNAIGTGSMLPSNKQKASSLNSMQYVT